MKGIVYRFVLWTVLFLVVSCGKQYNADDLQSINGYWEIEKVKMPDGEVKDYTINASIDYFEVSLEGVGFRQKVMPQINGEYLTNQVVEQFTIVNEENKIWLKYKTEFAEWKEELVKLDNDKFVVKNESDIIYFYKKAEAFSLK